MPLFDTSILRGFTRQFRTPGGGAVIPGQIDTEGPLQPVYDVGRSIQGYWMWQSTAVTATGPGPFYNAFSLPTFLSGVLANQIGGEPNDWVWWVLGRAYGKVSGATIGNWATAQLGVTGVQATTPEGLTQSTQDFPIQGWDNIYPEEITAGAGTSMAVSLAGGDLINGPINFPIRSFAGEDLTIVANGVGGGYTVRIGCLLWLMPRGIAPLTIGGGG